MRIKEIHIQSLQAPLLQPFRISTGQHDSLDNLLVALKLENGIVGWGEAAVASHITGETLEQTRSNLEIAAHVFVGQNIEDYLKISHWVHTSFQNNHATLAAIEMAVLDALTKSIKIPLWKMYGNKAHQLKTDITIVIASLEETQQKTKEFYKSGFRSFKVKIGKDLDLDIKRVHAVSKLAPRAQIILDANQGFNVPQALKFLKDIKKLNIKINLLEQPVPKEDRDGLKQISQSSSVVVCADESASSIADVIHLIKEKVVGAINIKLMKTGLVHSFEIARLAKAHGLQLMMGGMMESNLAMTAAAHLAAGTGYFDFIDLDTPFFIKGEVARNPYLAKNGIYDLSKVKAGIGV